MRVGDSLIEKIQGAIQSADGLVVVLSRASVASEWCKKELTSGLVRELEEKRVVVFPALLENCDIPLFLKDKLYADFRADFQAGLDETLRALSPLMSDTMGRVRRPGADIDYAMDWGIARGGRYCLRLTTIEPVKTEAHTIMTTVSIIGNAKATKRYRQYEKLGLDWLFRFVVLELVSEAAQQSDLRIALPDGSAQIHSVGIRDKKRGTTFRMNVTSRRVGADNGMTVLFDYGTQLRQILEGLKRTHRRATPDELASLQTLMTN
jgi:hypothetical protein